MAWFTRQKPNMENAAAEHERHVRTEGLWIKCDGCRQILWAKAIEDNLHVCPRCEHHFRIDAMARLRLLFDGEWQSWDGNLISTNPLQFFDSKSYADRLQAMRESTGKADAIVSASGLLHGRPVNICAIELKFIGGSMGAVVGETITRAIERSASTKHPLIVVSASGGARMQEGAVSLMQMAKITTALTRLSAAGVPFLSVLTDPTTGGVTASFAMLGDLNIAEPGALIGFAGPRVIEQTIRQKLPEGFQRSEFLVQHGFLDAVVQRRELKDYLGRWLGYFCDAATVPQVPALESPESAPESSAPAA